MGNMFAAGKRAIAECDICGFRYKRKDLQQLVIKTKNVNIMACPECWNPDQPQLQLGSFPVYDPQAIRNPRPDFPGYPQSRALNFVLNIGPIEPGDTFAIGQVVGFGSVGQVTTYIISFKCNYVNIQDCNFVGTSGVPVAFALNSVNNGNNSNWVFL